MSYLSSALKTFTAQLRLEGGVETQTLAGALTLGKKSANILRLDPGGANRDVNLPAEETSEGLFFFVFNAADASENLVLKSDAPATIVTIAQGGSALVGCDGAAWAVYGTSETSAAAAEDITLTDAASLITATDVEAALAEVFTRLPTNTVADPGNAGAIAVTRSGTCALVSAGAETRTLAAPSFRGQRLILCMDTDGGDIVLTVSAAFSGANTTITFNDAGDSVELVAAPIGGTLRWRLAHNDGCTLA